MQQDSCGENKYCNGLKIENKKHSQQSVKVDGKINIKNIVI